MYVTIDPPDTKSTKELIEYLDKETSLSREIMLYLDKEKHTDVDYFFNEEGRNIESYEAYSKLDKNCRGLGSEEARFYPIILSPSKSEIEHMENIANNVFAQMSIKDTDGIFKDQEDSIKESIIKGLLQEYSIKCMNAYAAVFERNGVQNAKDLVWFGRVEKERYWKAKSTPEVKKNEAIFKKIDNLLSLGIKEIDPRIRELQDSLVLESSLISTGRNIPVRDMMSKPGKNYHIHIVVSRNDKTQRIKLSPLANARGTNNHIIDGRKVRIGFNRDEFYQTCESVFDKTFVYEREYSNSYQGRKDVKFNREKQLVNMPEVISEMKNKGIIPNVIENIEFEHNERLDFPNDLIPSMELLDVNIGEISTDIAGLDISILTGKDQQLVENIAYNKIHNGMLKCGFVEEQARIHSDVVNMYIEFSKTNKIVVPNVYPFMDKYIEVIGANKDNFECFGREMLKPDDFYEIYNHAKMYCTNDVDLYREMKRMELSYYKDGYIETVYSVDNSNLFHSVESLSDGQKNNNYLNDIESEVIKKLSLFEVGFESTPKDFITVDYVAQTIDILNAQNLETNDYANYLSHNAIFGMFYPQENYFIQKYEISALSSSDIENIYGVAFSKARAKFPRRVDIHNEIQKEVEKMFWNYSSSGIISVPKCDSTHFHLNAEDCQGSIFRFKPFDVLSQKDMNTIEKVAKHIIENETGGKLNLMKPDDVRLMNRKINSLEYGYYQRGYINVPSGIFAEEKMWLLSGYNIDKCKFTEVEMLNPKDIKIIKEIAIAKVNAIGKRTLQDNGSLTREVTSEINKIQSSYYNRGVIIVPAIELSTDPDPNKFQKTTFRLLNNNDINAIENIAKEKINGFYIHENKESLSSKILSAETQRETEYMISLYYNRGVIKTPKTSIELTSVFSMSEGDVLSKQDCENIRQIAEAKVSVRYPGLNAKDKFLEIEREEQRLKYAYQESGNLLVPNISVNNTLDTTKFTVSEFSPLSTNEYQKMELLERDLLKVRIGENFSTLDLDDLAKQGVQRMENEYYRTGTMAILSSDKEQLTQQEYNDLFVLAEEKINAKYNDVELSPEQMERFVYKEIVNCEKRYNTTGEMFVYNTDLPVSDKFVVSEYKPLDATDYRQLEYIAKAKIESKYKDVNLTEKEKERFIFKDIAKMEFSYMKTGTIEVPVDVAGYDALNDPKYKVIDIRMLTKTDMDVLTHVATNRINAISPELPERELLNQVQKEINIMENKYYFTGQLKIPKLLYENVDLDKFQLAECSVLDAADYKVLQIVAENKVAEKINLSPEEMLAAKEKELRSLESRYYSADRNPKVTQQKNFLGFTSTSIEDRSRFVLPKGNYPDLDTTKFRVSNITILDEKDYSIINKVAEIKVASKFPELADNKRKKDLQCNAEIKRMENLYYREGVLDIPNISVKEYTNKFIVHNFYPLDTDDYKNIVLAARLKVEGRYLRMDAGKEYKNGIKPSNLADKKELEVEQEINKMEFLYNKNGCIYVPKSKQYINLSDKFVQIKERSLAQAIGVNLKNVAVSALYNAMGQDLKEQKEVISTTMRGVKLVKKIQRINKTNQSMQLVGAVSKSIVKTSTMRLVGVAIPYAGAIIEGVNIAKTIATGFNRQSGYER